MTSLRRIAAAVKSTWRLVVADVRAKAQNGYAADDLRAVVKTLATDGTAAMIVYRLMQGARAAGLTPLELVFNKVNSTFNGCVIGRGAEFGPGLVFVHANGIVINGKVRGGDNLTLEHQVTLGGGARGYPSLGSGVYVGAGARVLGGVAIGDNARIGANAVVIRDVPEGTTAVGVPARLVTKRR